MNVVITSQCDKRALTETRRILDQFAERIGHRTWQTPITQAGLDTLRRTLRKSARRNTAVACHWIHGKNYSELLWIVGSAARFNQRGVVPTNTTTRDVLRGDDENNWHNAHAIRLLAIIAALFHDFGKANRAFQCKLIRAKAEADAYRHEWVSLRLFQAFVGGADDREWLSRLATVKPGDDLAWEAALQREDNGTRVGPFADLTGLAQLVGWLIVSHHRLPLPPDDCNPAKLRTLPAAVRADWNAARTQATKQEKAACWEFPHGIPFSSCSWCDRANRVARAVLDHPDLTKRGSELADDPYVAHLARLVLMLSDHHYSSLPSDPRRGDAGYPLHANTDKETRQLKQRLDEHLIGVAHHARRMSGILPRLAKQLPRLARHRGLQRRTSVESFRWQNRAYDLAISVRERAERDGFFGVNMASTGCGKTLANGRIMYGLAAPERGARFSIALGLRTLTLQTGNVYRERLGLGDDDLAVLVGGAAVRELFVVAQKSSAEQSALERCGSESAEALMPEHTHVHYEANLEEGPLREWLKRNSSAAKLVQAPVVTCTIDHLVPATESQRGGRQIAPMLRLLTSDLVLDEPDDFDTADLPAVTRLVHWAGLLGSRVLLSSATLPPSLTQGLFEAYRAGRQVFERNRGIPGKPLAICCAWFDEYGCETSAHASSESFAPAHAAFAAQRRDRVAAEPQRRRATVHRPGTASRDRAEITAAVASDFLTCSVSLHSTHYSVDPGTGKRVSFGLIRMANIRPLIDVARAMFASGAPKGMRIHLCVYHSRHPLAFRAAIEQQLDAALSRHDPVGVFEVPAVRAAIDAHEEIDQLFIALASPVAEVGRDHDYDWAVVEPSSMRSIIQLAGRVRRHRPGACGDPNLVLLARNFRGLLGECVVFCRPGFERDDFRLEPRTLEELLTSQQLEAIHAGPRIVERPELSPSANLVDLEHARLRALMLGGGGDTNRDIPVSDWWTTRAPLSGVLQRAQRFRAGAPTDTYALIPDENTGQPIFHCRDEANAGWKAAPNLLEPIPLLLGPRIQPWGPPDIAVVLQQLQDRFGDDLEYIARRYATLELEPNTQGWTYHPALGVQQRE